MLDRGKIKMEHDCKLHVLPLEAAFEFPEQVPEETAATPKYTQAEKYTISELAGEVDRRMGGADVMVHCIASAPEVQSQLLATSQEGYLAAVRNSSFSMIGMLRQFGPMLSRSDWGAALTLSYAAADRVVPGYGGGMSSAKAALQSDVRTLAWEAGQEWGVRVNCISAGPLASRAAKAIGNRPDGGSRIDQMISWSQQCAPLKRPMLAADVGSTAGFLLSRDAAAITGSTVFVDNGLHVMAPGSVQTV
eukprot:TRINITY_DN11363_c0_g1_i3.p1 TRINITY_DN11363_c0_g1~~TRINITY_DN11363_c0_g1_i3.p1  ORF type:complete len:248 (-),score=61.77 TRINITY_DN11363_c0_g1_i3:459-1202(-)